MRRNQKRVAIYGRICIAAGLMVLMSRFVPAGFWWIMLGISLISVGLYMKHWC